MTRTTIAVCLLILLAGFIGFHTYEIYALSKDVNQLCDSIEPALDNDDWDNVCSGTEELQNRWNKSRLWASLTIDTAKIEEIEICAKALNMPSFIPKRILLESIICSSCLLNICRIRRALQ